jgi:homoserine kinase
VPEATLSTHVARGLLPATVPHADAACAAGRAALLVHALTAAPEFLLEATEDRLHQRQRSAAMPASLDLLDTLRAAGHAAVVSGAGPSLLVLGQWQPGDEQGQPDRSAAVRDIAALTPDGWSVHALPVDADGACVDAVRPQVSSG